MDKKFYTDIDLVGNGLKNINTINSKPIGDVDHFTVQLLSNVFDGSQFLSLIKNGTTTIYVRSKKLTAVKAKLYNLLDSKIISSIKVNLPLKDVHAPLDDNDCVIPIDIITGNELEKVLYLDVTQLPNPYLSHDYVDMGLPSGTLWAKNNILGWDSNDRYFQWGDIVGNKTYPNGPYNSSGNEGTTKFRSDLSDYKYYDSSSKSYIKYNSTDKLTILEDTDNAAKIIWGGDWDMPTSSQMDELLNPNNTAYSVVEINGTKYGRFTSKIEGFTDRFIDFPLNGYLVDGSFSNIGISFFIWSKSIRNQKNRKITCMKGIQDASVRPTVYGEDAYYGFNIRPVINFK